VCASTRSARSRSTAPGAPSRSRGSQVRIKLAHRDGVLVTATPEFEDAARAAEQSGLAVREVLDLAAAAAVAAGLTPGAPVPD